MPTEGIIEFLLYIAPGYIAIQLIRSRWPVEKRDNFHDIATSVIMGVVILSALKWIDSHRLNYFFESNLTDFPSLRFILGIVLFGSITGGVIIGLKEIGNMLSKRAKYLKFLAPGTDSVWVNINGKDNKDWALVYLDDGSIYLGWISIYTFNPNHQNQEFLLSRAKRLYENLDEMYEIDGCGIYLNTKDVKRIEFRTGDD
jgi:hypothetical protein